MRHNEHHTKPPIPPVLAWPATTDEHDRVRAARGCPATDILCGSVDGSLWQVARPLARTVAAHCQECALCRFDRVEWGRALTPWERSVAIWRQVPLRVRVALLLLCVGLAADAQRQHTVNRTLGWLQCPVNGRFYLAGGEYEDYAEAKRYARRQRARPVVIRTEAEQLWLRDRRARPDVGYLLGLREVGRQGRWQWLTGEPLTWTNWAPGEPARPTDARLRVAVMRNGEWYARPVPEDLDEEPIRFAILERRSDPRSAWEPARLLAWGWWVVALGLLLNIGAVLVQRRLVAVRIYWEPLR